MAKTIRLVIYMRNIFAVLIILIIIYNMFSITTFLASRNIKILKSNTFFCQFQEDFNYDNNRAYYFHSMDAILEFEFISSHAEIVGFAEDIDFDNYDLVISFGREVLKVYRTSVKFRGKFIPDYTFSKQFMNNTAYYFYVKKDAGVADALEYPLG